jgi:hypothetical protein
MITREHGCTVIPINDLTLNQLQEFEVEDERGGMNIRVEMHPKCWVDMCTAGPKALCPFCLLRLDFEFRHKPDRINRSED